jgi:hypothetical protein
MSRSRARLLDNVSALIVRNTHPVERVKAGGVFKAECFDQHGRLKWTLESKNIVVNVGLQYMAGAALTGTTQIPTWYLGLYGAAATNTPAAGDTMASHPGWNEFTGYSNATRPTAVFAPAQILLLLRHLLSISQTLLVVRFSHLATLKAQRQGRYFQQRLLRPPVIGT